MKRSLFVLAALIVLAALSGCISSPEEFDAKYGVTVGQHGETTSQDYAAQQGIPVKSAPRGGFSVVLIIFGVIGVIALSLPGLLASRDEGKTFDRRR